VALHTVCTTVWMWNFYSERTADGREGRTRTSSEQCRKSRTMSRVVVVVFRGRQYQKPQIDRAASVLRSHHDPVRQECLQSTRNTAVSVEWLARYADCKSGNSFHMFRWSTSCRATRCSTVFDNTDRFDIGLYDSQSAGSMSYFFSSAAMNADLNGVGNTPDDKDRWGGRRRPLCYALPLIAQSVAMGGRLNCQPVTYIPALPPPYSRTCAWFICLRANVIH